MKKRKGMIFIEADARERNQKRFLAKPLAKLILTLLENTIAFVLGDKADTIDSLKWFDAASADVLFLEVFAEIGWHGPTLCSEPEIG